MSKEHILKNGNSPRVLKYILENETFDMEDYKLLVENTTTKYQEYLIPLIKYKFNLEPDLSVLSKANYGWKYLIANDIKFDINMLDYYLDNPEEYNDDILNELVERKTVVNSITDNTVLIRLFEMNYHKTLKTILKRYKTSLDLDLVIKFEPILQSSQNHYYSSWLSSFVSHEALYKYIEIIRNVDKETLMENLHLLNTDEEIDNFLEVCNKYNVKSSYNLFTESLIKKNKKLIKLYFSLEKPLYMNTSTVKLIKNNQHIWKYITLKNVRSNIDFEKYNINTEYDKLLEDIYKTVKDPNKRYNIDEDNILLFIDIILTQVKWNRNKLEKVRDKLNEYNKFIRKDLEKFTENYIKLLNKYLGENKIETKINCELPILKD